MSLLQAHSQCNLSWGGLLSSNSSVRRRQLSRFQGFLEGNRYDVKKTRALRKAKYKQKLQHSKLPKDLAKAIEVNPHQHGAPRAFKVLLAGQDVAAKRKIHDKSFFKDEGNTVYFASFGVPGRAIRLNNVWVPPERIVLSPEKNIYTLSTKDANGGLVSLFLDFTLSDKPTGYLSLPEGDYAVNLQPYAVQFNVQVSANAGAYQSTGKQTLVWDENSTQWASATWESGGMTFAYDTYTVTDPFGKKSTFNEAAYTDTIANETFQLTYDLPPDSYTCIFQGGDENQPTYCLTTVSDLQLIPPPPEVRVNDDIKSVFPVQSLFGFDSYGTSFTGAYLLPNGQVYAVIGTGIGPGTDESGLVFHSSLPPIPDAFHRPKALGDPDLTVNGLLNLNPMVEDDSSPTGYSDEVSSAANADINQIITYYMDDNIRTTFVQAAPITFDDQNVEAIATDNTENKAFYQQLQVPYVTASLARSDLDEAKQCNGIRAQAQLKNIPQSSPVYQSQSDQLYRYRYSLQFPIINQYLQDQADPNNNYNPIIQNGATIIKNNLASVAQGMGTMAGDPTTAASNLADAQADVDALCTWATSQNLFWAFDLYYWCTQYYVPNLYAQCTNGTISPSVSRNLKSLSGTFGMLEGSLQNPNGKSFQQAFNDVVRLYQMSALIPQFVDADGNSEDFDSILKAMLQQFAEDNSQSLDQNISQEADNADQLAAQDDLRGNFFQSLAMSIRLYGTLDSWNAIYNQFNNINNASSWFIKLVNGASMAATFLRSACVVLLIFPFLGGLGWRTMTPEEKTGFIVNLAGIALSLTIKAIQGVLRIGVYWSDLGGLCDCFKAFFGFDSVINALPEATDVTTSEIALWFVRTGPETMTVTGDEITIGMQIFGRSAGEFLTNAVGALLAGVNVVLSIIDAVKSTDPLQKSMDSMMVISGSLQLLATGAGWLLSSEIVSFTAGVAICQTVASCAGPLAILFAVVGLAIMIAMMFLHKNPPNPVDQFLQNYAKKAGLVMAYDTDIDYFNIVPPDGGTNSLTGISFFNTLLTGDMNGYLQLGPEDSSTTDEFAIQAASKLSYLPDTCWSVQTDSEGNTTIFTYAMDSQQTPVTVCLAIGDDGTLQAMPPPATTTVDGNGNEIPVDPKVYAQQVAQQQWTCQCVSNASSVTIDGETYPLSASFVISQGSQYLIGTESDNSFTVGLGPAITTNAIWILTLQPMGPAPFQYVQPNWNLTTQSSDESNYVNFSGPTSLPLQWSITPALPPFLQFADPIADGGTNGGTIEQVSGMSPIVSSATTYLVTGSVIIDGYTYKQSCNVTITVLDPNNPPSNPIAVPTVKGKDKNVGISTSVLPQPTVTGVETRSRRSAQLGSAGQGDKKSLQKSSESEDPETIQQNYDQMMQNAPPFFKWSQTQAIPLYQHYTATPAISKMQNALTGSWRGGPFESLYFPEPTPGPSIEPGDPCDYHGAADAYVTQEIYNSDSYAQQYCDLNDVQSTISTFNSNLFNSNKDRYQEWLQWSGSSSTTGGLCTYDEYVSCIESPDWIAEKAAEQTDGTWNGQSMEMFFHFLKLAALGATDDQINGIYQAITVRSSPTQPVLDPSGFADITPSSWAAYRSYLQAGNISSSQLGVQNIGQIQRYGFNQGGEVPSEVTITAHADTEFLQNSGYYQAPPSGSCIRGSAKVLMGDKTLKPISALQAGDCVLSVSNNGSQYAREVAFVSRPGRRGRALYSFRHIPNILFTDTHPLYFGIDRHGSTILGFINLQKALQVNPLWGSFTLRSVPSDDLVQISPACHHDETLFDLVFNQSAETFSPSFAPVPNFTVRSDDSQDVVICSEAPNPCLLPSITAFVLAFTAAISTSKDTLHFFPEGLAAGILDYRARIGRHRSACAVDAVSGTVNHQDTILLASQATQMSTLLAVLNGGQLDAQTVADCTEAIIASLGLSTQAIADNGWQAIPQSLSERCLAISIHFIQLSHPDLHPKNTPLPTGYSKILASLSRALISSEVKVNVQMSLPGVSQDSASHVVSIQTLGPHLFKLHAIITAPFTEEGVLKHALCGGPEYTATISVGSEAIWLTATGNLTEDVDGHWPVYLSQMPGVDRSSLLEMSFWHVGWLTVTGACVSAGQLALAKVWDNINPSTENQDAVSYGMKYSALLGQAVGRDIVRSVCGSYSDGGNS